MEAPPAWQRFLPKGGADGHRRALGAQSGDFMEESSAISSWVLGGLLQGLSERGRATPHFAERRSATLHLPERNAAETPSGARWAACAGDFSIIFSRYARDASFCPSSSRS